MKVLNYFSVFACLVALCIYFTSCQKEELADIVNDNKISAKVINGTLHFATLEDLTGTLNTLAEMPRKEIDEWEIQNGFYSIRRMTNEVFNKIGIAKSEQEVEAIILQNQHLVKKTEDGIKPVLDILNYRSICNKDGVYFIENTLNKVKGEFLIGVEDWNQEKLDIATRTMEANEKAGIYIATIPKPEFHSLRANCGNLEFLTVYNNAGDRGLQFAAYTSYNVFILNSGLKIYQPYGQIVAQAIKRFNIGWTLDQTNISIPHACFTVCASGMSFSATYPQVSSVNSSSISLIQNAPFVLFSSPSPSFTRVTGEAYSSATTVHNKARIDCGSTSTVCN